MPVQNFSSVYRLATEKLYRFSQVRLEFDSYQKRKSRHTWEKCVEICDLKKMQIWTHLRKSRRTEIIGGFELISCKFGRKVYNVPACSGKGEGRKPWFRPGEATLTGNRPENMPKAISSISLKSPVSAARCVCWDRWSWPFARNFGNIRCLIRYTGSTVL